MHTEALDAAVPRAAGHAGVVGREAAHRAEVPGRQLGGRNVGVAVVGRLGVRQLMLFQQGVEVPLEARLERLAFASALALRLEGLFEFRRLLVHHQVRVRVVVEVVLFEAVDGLFLAADPRRRVQNAPQTGVFHPTRLPPVAAAGLVERSAHRASGFFGAERLPLGHQRVRPERLLAGSEPITPLRVKPAFEQCVFFVLFF